MPSVIELVHVTKCYGKQTALYERMTATEIGWFTAGFYADGFEHEFRHAVPVEQSHATCS